MKLKKTTLSVAMAMAAMGGSAHAAEINCTLTPANSIITQSQTLQLAATCEGGPLSTITWKQGSTDITGAIAVALSGDTSKPIYFTTPAGAAGDYVFTVLGVAKNGTDTFGSSSEARVLVNASTTSFSAPSTPSASTPPVNAVCGFVSGNTVLTYPSNGQLCATGKSSLVITAPAYMTWSCLGQSGGLESNCFVTKGVTYSVTASAGPNGSISPTGTQTIASGSTTSFNVSAAGGYNIAGVTGCSGTLNGNTYTTGALSSNCAVSATFSAQASSYTVTATAGPNGSISPASQTVNSGANTSFTVSASSGYSVSGVTGTGCSGSLNGNTYTTGAISSACTVSATFSANPSGSSGDNSIGSGLWVSGNRTVADQSGSATMRVSYVPGCLNGLYSANSGSGCSAQTTFTDTNTGRVVSLGSGNQLVLRYKALPTAGAEVKSIRARSYDGGNVGVNMRVWLSTSPTATYETVAAACRGTSTRSPTVFTGPGYCPITPGALYYFGIVYDEAIANRFQIDELSADFE